MFSPSTNITKIDESIQKLKSKIQREGTQNTDVIRYVGNFLKKILVMESGFILTRIDLGIKKKNGPEENQEMRADWQLHRKWVRF